MKFELKIAWRYFRTRRKSLTRLTSLVAVAGIAVGVASLIIAQSLAQGFQDEMQNKILANTAHLSIFLKDGTQISNWQEVKLKLETVENITEITPTSFENALVNGESQTSYAIIKVQSSKFKVQSSKSENQSPNTKILTSNEIAVGAKLAEKLNLKIGDTAEIVTLEHQTPLREHVAEIFETGLYDYDSAWIYVAPENYAYLHGQTDFVPDILSVSVNDIYAADRTARKAREILGENFTVLDWQEANRPLFAALSLERKVSFAIISLIIFVAVLNITTTLALLTNERNLDIAVLRTCGAKTKSLLLIFLLEGLILGLIGTFCGAFLGLIVCAAGNYFKIINLPAEVYSLNYIPFRPNLLNILLIILTALALCLLAAVYPAFRASRLKPLTVIGEQ